MELQTAIDLISNPQIQSSNRQKWADLGSGSGIFTQALAHHLAADSEIFAVDQDASALASIPARCEGVKIHTRMADFTAPISGLPKLDGILMANALHFVKDKKSFIRSWETLCKEPVSFLIIEYDTSRSNSWVPYPIASFELENLFREIGYRNIVKLREIPSLYHNKIYATILNK